jgi:hypothetical protein
MPNVGEWLDNAPVRWGYVPSVRVIDAQNFAAPPVARVELPQRVPFGFHGNFIAA